MFQLHSWRRSAIDASAIHVTQQDLERLRGVVATHEAGPDAVAAQQLEAELDRAVVVRHDELPEDVVTMHSRVVFEDETGRRRDVQLVYPSEAAPERGRISIFEHDELRLGATYATLNCKVLEERAAFAQPAVRVEYDQETVDDRMARRRHRWTPAVVR